MSEVHLYKAVKMLSQAGNVITYQPHGPNVVLAEEYEKLAKKLAECEKREELATSAATFAANITESAANRLAALQSRLDLAAENAAKAVYSQWSKDPDFVLWVDRGNSMKQDDARMIARAFLSQVAGDEK